MIRCFSIVGWLLTLGVALVVFVVLYTVLSVVYLVWKGEQKLEYYRKQGCAVRLSPEKRTQKNHLTVPANSVTAPSTALTMIAGPRPITVIEIHNSELVKEFLLKEDQFEKTSIFPHFDNLLGFFFHNGEKCFKEKAIFSKIFDPKGMEIFSPKICKIIQLVYARVETESGINTETFTRVNLQAFIDPIIRAITDFVIFGKESPEPNDDMIKLSQLTIEISRLLEEINTSPIYNLFPTLAKKWNIVPGLKRLAEILSEETAILEKLIKSRENLETLDESVIDRIILHNRECKLTGNTDEIVSPFHVAGHYNVFQIAGSSSTQISSVGAICMMADKPQTKAYWQKIAELIYNVDGIATNDAMDNCEILQLCTKEVLRMHPPLSHLFFRKAIKDITLGSLIIKKHDLVTVKISYLNYSPVHFKDPQEFNPARFRKEANSQLPKYQFIPFSAGKRVCMGRYLGERIVQHLICQFVRLYDFSKPDDVVHYDINLEVLMVANPWLNIRRKPN